MYKIIGKYKLNGVTEILDFAKTMSEALKLRNEYIMAYGKNWTIDIQKETNNV